MTHMKAILAGCTALALAAPAMAQDDETKVIGVSIPAATHGWVA